MLYGLAAPPTAVTEGVGDDASAVPLVAKAHACLTSRQNKKEKKTYIVRRRDARLRYVIVGPKTAADTGRLEGM